MQEFAQRIAALLQQPSSQADEADDTLTALLGQALGFTLCVAAFNSRLMLRLQSTRLNTLGDQLTQPVPNSHWDQVLVRPWPVLPWPWPACTHFTKCVTKCVGAKLPARAHQASLTPVVLSFTFEGCQAEAALHGSLAESTGVRAGKA